MSGLPPVKFTFKKFISYTALILAIAISFLFSPQPVNPKAYCGRYIKLNSHMGFTFNCDAPGYMEAAHNLKDLTVQPGYNPVRQSRPLYILAGTITGYPIQWILDAAHINFFYKIDPRFGAMAGFYAAFIIMNYLLLLGSLYFLERIALYITNGHLNRWVLLGFQIFLLSNIITKAFFWTPHQQFFSLFTPLVGVFMIFYIKEHQITPAKLGLISFLCGLAMLMYGNFLPMYGCLLVASCVVTKNYKPLGILKSMGLFLLPTVAWMLICKTMLGGYYNHEMEQYRQLVWITDTLKVSFATFLHTFAGYFMMYMRMFRQLQYFIAAMLILLAYIALQKKINKDAQGKLLLMGISFVVFFLFFLALGYYDERLAFTLYPIILCIMLLETDKISWLKSKPVIIVLIALAWHMYNVLSYGPFS